MALSFAQLEIQHATAATADEQLLIDDIVARIDQRLTAAFDPDIREYEFTIESETHWLNISVDRFRNFILANLAAASWTEYEVEPVKEPNTAGSRNFLGFYVRVKQA